MGTATLEILRTETLSKVRDGQLRDMIDAELSAAYADCVDRPLLKKGRKVTIEIEIAPTGQDDPLGEVDVAFQVNKKLPPQVFNRRMKSIAKSKGLGFYPDTDNVSFDSQQKTLDDH